MYPYLLILGISLLFLNQTPTADLPPFIFPELDRAVISLWLAADDRSPSAVESAEQQLRLEWQRNREEINEFPLTAYNPYLLTGSLEAMVNELAKAKRHQDYEEIQAIADRFLWEFQTIREFHRQNFYPLDLWWEVQAVYEEVHHATHDPRLALLEWQELECLFDEMVCLLVDYEQRAESYLTQYAPAVDEDAHKAAINQVYQCISDYQSALSSGYQERLVWPCDQLGGSLKVILKCYLTENEI